MQKPLEILWNLDPKSRVVAPTSRVFARSGAKALDFGANAPDFSDFLAESLVEFQVGAVPLGYMYTYIYTCIHKQVVSQIGLWNAKRTPDNT